MKFKVNRNHFFNGLACVTNIVGSRVTMPILQNVLIEAEGETVTLTTTVIDITVSCKVKAVVSTPGRITLPVKRLATIVRALPSADVTVDLAGKERVKLSSGTATFQVSGLGAEQFPPINGLDGKAGAILDQEALGSILRKVSYAQSTDENRYILNGVFFEFEADKLNVVATDGRRLAKSELAVMNDLKKEVIYALGGAFEAAGKAKEAIDEYKVIYTADASYRDVSAKINAFYDKQGS
jgi:DNA polymerase-3 subunit beta